MVYEGIHQPMPVSLAVRRAQVPSNGIHRSLAQTTRSNYCGILEASTQEKNLTVPRNDLYDIYGTSLGEQVFPSPYEKPVISAVNPLERIQRSSNENMALTYILVP